MSPSLPSYSLSVMWIQGLQVFSLDDTMQFAPTDLDITITPQSVAATTLKQVFEQLSFASVQTVEGGWRWRWGCTLRNSLQGCPTLRTSMLLCNSNLNQPFLSFSLSILTSPITFTHTFSPFRAQRLSWKAFSLPNGPDSLLFSLLTPLSTYVSLALALSLSLSLSLSLILIHSQVRV